MSVNYKISRVVINSVEAAGKYYQIVALLNNIHITPLQARILGWAGTQNINGKGKRDFAKAYNTTIPTINNNISLLIDTNLLVKNRDININPQLPRDFPNPLEFNISLSYGN